MPTFIDVMALPTSSRSAQWLLRHLERDDVGVHLIEELERRLVRLDAAEHPLLHGLPQHVWHHTSVFARRPFTVLLKTFSMNSGVITGSL